MQFSCVLERSASLLIFLLLFPHDFMCCCFLFRVLFLFVLFNFFRLWRKQLTKCTRSSRIQTTHYVLLINCFLKTCLSDFIMKINERLLTWKHLFHRTIFNLLLIRDEQYCLVQCVTNRTFDTLCINQKPWSYESIGYTE